MIPHLILLSLILLSPLNMAGGNIVEDGDVYSYFHTLDDMPYNFSSYHTKTVAELYRDGWGDCDDKAYAFHQYLNKKGYIGNQYVIIHRHGVVNHVFNTYNGLAFDVDRHVYGVPLDEYLGQIYREYPYDSYELRGN